MRWHARLWTLGLLLPTLLTAVPARAQYLFLDSNGDGLRDAQDRLADDGPTTLDVWLVTDRSRDGTPALCDQDPNSALTINSYSFVLHAIGGTMAWGPMENRVPFTIPPGRLASDNDTTDPVYYHNGWAGREVLPPGRYKLATLTVEPTSGRPGIYVEPYIPYLPTRITCFGTQCDGIDFDNTYKLGTDWHDARGLGPPHAEAGGPYFAVTGEDVTFRATGSCDPEGLELRYRWDFGDGAAGEGASATHAYAAEGRYTARLTVESGNGTDTATTEAAVTGPHEPTAIAGGPYTARAGEPVHFSGSRSIDPDGDALRFDWEFGDGFKATGVALDHSYATEGSYVARLTVGDGTFTDSDVAAVTILPGPTAAPVANPGGPYTGLAGRGVQFDGRQSYDADGQTIYYSWHFGDGTTGFGASTGHSYAAAGVYDVTLIVSDGTLTGSAVTTATILRGMEALVLTDGPGPPAIYVGPGEEPLALNVQAARGDFDVMDIDPLPIMMHSDGTGSVAEILAQEPVLADQDLNHDGVRELTVPFAAEDLARLFDRVTHPEHVTVTISGHFYRGGEFYGELSLEVRPGEDGLLVISPNPFNPQALISFHLTRPGPVRADLFDVRGRMVRTVIHGEPMGPGTHEVILDANGAGGATLASGVYFLRLDGPDGILTARVAVTK